MRFCAFWQALDGRQLEEEVVERWTALDDVEGVEARDGLVRDQHMLHGGADVGLFVDQVNVVELTPFPIKFVFANEVPTNDH